MKAFNPIILSENYAEQRNEVRDIIMSETKLISLLECEEYGLLQELDARREYYIDILENADLEVYNEAVGGKVIAAIIAAIVAIVGAIIAMISGKGNGGGSSGGGSGSSGSGSSSSRDNTSSRKSTSNSPNNSSSSSSINSNDKPKKNSTGFDKFKSNNHFDTGKFYNATDIDNVNRNSTKLFTSIERQWMPMISKLPQYSSKTGSIAGINRPAKEWFNAFSYVAQQVTADITEYTFPNNDVVIGELDSIDDISDVCDDLKRTIKTLIDKATESDNIDGSIFDSDIEKMNNRIERISENIDKIQSSGDESSKRVIVSEYLRNIPPYINRSNPTHNYNKYIFLNIIDMEPSKKLNRLKFALHSIVYDGNYLPNNEQHPGAAKYTSQLIDIANKLKSVTMTICGKIKSAFTNYFKLAEKDAAQREELAIMIQDEMLNFNRNYNNSLTDKYNARGFTYQDVFDLYRRMYGHSPSINDDETEDQNEKNNNESTIFNYNADNFNDFYNEMNEIIGRYNVRHAEYQIRAVNEEALIFASESTDIEKFNKLKAVNESIGNKIKRAFYNTIAKLKEIFAKFMEKLRGNFTTTKNYLDKYKDIILKKPFKNNNNYKTQDLVLGINRIMNSEVPQLDLAGMNETLDNQDTFFKSVYTKVPNGTSEYKDNMDQAAFWKTYFCMQGHDKEYTGTMFQQQALKECYEFLYDIRKTENTIKKSIKNIDDTITRVMKQAGADVSKPNDEPTNESVVWSYLYQKPFVLENGVLHELERVPNVNTQTTTNTTTKEGVKTVSKTPEGQEDPDNVGTAKKSQRPIMDTRCNNYAIVCSNMLKAKMSACEFIRSEGMGIIRAHVQSYIGQTAVKDGEEKKPEEEKNKEKDNSIEERNKRAQEYIDKVEKRRK